MKKGCISKLRTKIFALHPRDSVDISAPSPLEMAGERSDDREHSKDLKCTLKKLVVIVFLLCGAYAQTANAQSRDWTKEQWELYFNDHMSQLDPIEGIWYTSVKSILYMNNVEMSETRLHKSNQAHSSSLDHYTEIYKKGDNFEVYSSVGEPNEKLVLSRSGLDNVYVLNKYSTSGNFKTTTKILLGRLMDYTIEMPHEQFKKAVLNGDYTNTDGSELTKEQKKQWLASAKQGYKYTLMKIFPPSSKSTNRYISGSGNSAGNNNNGGNNNYGNNNHVAGSATGFALTSNGYIATNYHVVNGATRIVVSGINGDFSKRYNARIATVDRNNDLAIIQIDDAAFKGAGKIPYTISSRTSDVGSAVFVLGYPMTTSMGNEIKLTNGIISSRSGYKGDVTTYQISAPIQPGNSGGPMFDNNGNLVGIVNARLTNAENASYAIKTTYLLNLIESLPTAPDLPTTNTVGDKPLPEQVKIVKNFTYFIEVE